MGGGTDRVPPNDYGTNLGREEEKILTGKEKTLQKKVHGEVCLDGAVVVIDRMTAGRRRAARDRNRPPELTPARLRRRALQDPVSRGDAALKPRRYIYVFSRKWPRADARPPE